MKKVYSLLIIFCSFIVSANDEKANIDQLMTSFTECDSQFFSKIALYKSNLAKYATIKDISPNQAYIMVKDRSINSQNYYHFNTPIIYQSLNLTGYYDSSLSLGKYGDYYFWGFIVDNSIEQIKTTLNALKWDEMEEDSLYITHAKIHYNSDKFDSWQSNSNAIEGVKTLPQANSVEKLLMLEKSPEMTLLVCSIQGFLSPTLLNSIRPDIEQK